MEKRTFGRRINEWLYESPGHVHRQGKWRFWFPTLIGLTALNAVMTAVIFGQDGAQKYIGSIVVLAGATLCWLALDLLHYSDSEDRALAIGVAALDSLTLLFVAVHFSFLLWRQGHLWTLRAAEEKYRRDLAEYNAQITPISADNARIRVAGFGELALSIITLIFVRIRSAATNARRAAYEEDFPESLDVEKRLPVRCEKFSPKKETAKDHRPSNSEGLKRLREALKDVSFRLPGLSFKSRTLGDAVLILMVKANIRN